MSNLNKIIVTKNIAKNIFKIKTSRLDLLESIGFWDKAVTFQDLVDGFQGTIFESAQKLISECTVSGDDDEPVLTHNRVLHKNIESVTTMRFNGIEVIVDRTETSSDLEERLRQGTIRKRDIFSEAHCILTLHTRYRNTTGIEKFVSNAAGTNARSSLINSEGRLCVTKTVHKELIEPKGSHRAILRTIINKFDVDERIAGTTEEYTRYTDKLPDGGSQVFDEENGNTISVYNAGGMLLSKTSRTVSFVNEIHKLRGLSLLASSTHSNGNKIVFEYCILGRRNVVAVNERTGKNSVCLYRDLAHYRKNLPLFSPGPPVTKK